MIDYDSTPRYSMALEWDPRDEVSIATVPELAGCRIHGRSLEEAIRNGREVTAIWIESTRKWHDPIPSAQNFQGATDGSRMEDVVGGR